MGQDIHPQIGPIGIAQHGMALPVFVDHQFHRLIRYLPDLVMQGGCQPGRSPAIDHNHPVRRDDKAQVVVVARVFIGRRGGGSDGGKDMGDHLDRFGIELGLGILVGDILARHGCAGDRDGGCGQGSGGSGK